MTIQFCGSWNPYPLGAYQYCFCREVQCHISKLIFLFTFLKFFLSLKVSRVPCINHYKIFIIKVNTNQVNWTYISQFFKVLMYFWDKSGSVWILVDYALSVEITRRRDYFYQNHGLEERFLSMCHKTHFSISSLKFAPSP